MCKPSVNCIIPPKTLVKPPKGLRNSGKSTHKGGSLAGENYRGDFLEEGWKA